jgi:hypothetical protein
VVESTKTVIVQVVPIQGDPAFAAQRQSAKARQEVVDARRSGGLVIGSLPFRFKATRDP